MEYNKDIIKDIIRDKEGTHTIIYGSVFHGKIPKDAIKIIEVIPTLININGMYHQSKNNLNVSFYIRDDGFTLTISRKEYNRRINLIKLVGK